MVEDGYPLYRRRDVPDTDENENRRAPPNSTDIRRGNEWVVPYNPWLCMKYNAHIDVELTTGVKVVKYLYIYIFKGPDRAHLETTEGSQDEVRKDETKEFLEGSYWSASQASWHIARGPMHGEGPSVVKLSVHLPNEQPVVFNPDRGNPLRPGEAPMSALISWMETNKTIATGRDLLCAEFPRRSV